MLRFWSSISKASPPRKRSRSSRRPWRWSRAPRKVRCAMRCRCSTRRSRMRRVPCALMKGDIPAALKELREQYDIGADPGVFLSDLAEFTHFVTRVKVVPSVADDVSLSEAERVRGRAFATQLSMRVLSRTWQMLLKGVGEVQASGRPVAAAEMILVRIAYAADLPTPDEVVRSLGEEGAARPPGNGGAPAAPAPAQNFTPR